MSHLLPFIVEYTTINIDSDYRLPGGKSHLRKQKACDRAFDDFKRLRGQVVSHAIAVEHELENIAAAYFVRGACGEPSEDGQQIRERQFIDLLLGQPSVTFAYKMDLVNSIFGAGEVAKPKQGFERLLRPIMEIRNQFAHRRVGIDWQDQTIGFWDSGRREWGFCDQGKKWNVRIPSDFGQTYGDVCKKAFAQLHNIWSEVVRLREPQS